MAIEDKMSNWRNEGREGKKCGQMREKKKATENVGIKIYGGGQKVKSNENALSHQLQPIFKVIFCAKMHLSI